MACDLLFLQQYVILSHEFLERIVTGDETWVHYHAPETNRASMEWKHPGSPRTKKFEMVKLMATVFWDHKGVLLVEFMKKGTTINAALYCATLERLKTAIKRKRPGLLTKGVSILHDNARSHVATATQEFL
jgi:hypothetical protein